MNERSNRLLDPSAAPTSPNTAESRLLRRLAAPALARRPAVGGALGAPSLRPSDVRDDMPRSFHKVLLERLDNHGAAGERGEDGVQLRSAAARAARGRRRRRRRHDEPSRGRRGLYSTATEHARRSRASSRSRCDEPPRRGRPPSPAPAPLRAGGPRRATPGRGGGAHRRWRARRARVIARGGRHVADAAGRCGGGATAATRARRLPRQRPVRRCPRRRVAVFALTAAAPLSASAAAAARGAGAEALTPGSGQGGPRLDTRKLLGRCSGRGCPAAGGAEPLRCAPGQTDGARTASNAPRQRRSGGNAARRRAARRGAGRRGARARRALGRRLLRAHRGGARPRARDAGRGAPHRHTPPWYTSALGIVTLTDI